MSRSARLILSFATLFLICVNTTAAPQNTFPLAVGEKVTLREALTPSRMHYFKVGDREVEVEIRPSRIYPLYQEIPSVEIVKIWREEEPIGYRVVGEPGKRALVSPAGPVLHRWSIKLKHQQLGKAEFRFRARNEDDLTNKEFMEQVLGTLFKGSKIPVTPRFRKNVSSGMVHYAASGHCDNTDLLIEAVTPDSLKCKLCFPKVNPLPLLREEMMVQSQLLSAIRQTYVESKAPDLQERVSAAGRRVLAQWPFRLKGYDYEFSVLKSASFNACACPAGFIFVTEGLLTSLDSDAELEAVLAHEIAHVEMRHSLKELFKQRQAAANAQLIGAVAQIGVAAVAVHNKIDIESASVLGNAAGFISSVVAYQILIDGYSEEQEEESDLIAFMYHQKLNKNREPLLRVLGKVRTDENNRGERTRSVDSSHPPTDHRIYMIRNCIATFLDESKIFDLVHSEDETICSLALIAMCQYKEQDGSSGTKLFTEIEALLGIAEAARVKSLDVKHNGGVLSFASEQLITLPPLSSQSVVFTRAGVYSGAQADIDNPTIPGLKVKKSIPRSR